MPNKILWCTDTINPIQDKLKGKFGRGYHCTKISPGCNNCWAESMNNRFGNRLPFDGRKAEFELIRSELEKPLRWKKPRRIFVQSMGDLFHEDVADFDIFRVVRAMHKSNFNGNKHTFILLTKRPERMAAYFADFKNSFGSGRDYKFYEENPSRATRNMWLGVTAENQEQADKRILILLQIPAAVYLVSHEPALGLINYPPEFLKLGKRAWLINGGESGHGARPMHPDIPRHDRNQCVSAGVPFFFKQWGEWTGEPGWYLKDGTKGCKSAIVDSNDMDKTGISMGKVDKKVAGRLLDGRTHEEYPGGK